MCFEGERPLDLQIAFGSGGRMGQINNDSAKMNNAREKWESCRGGGLKLRFASWEICWGWNKTEYIDVRYVLKNFERTGSMQISCGHWIEEAKKPLLSNRLFTFPPGLIFKAWRDGEILKRNGKSRVADIRSKKKRQTDIVGLEKKILSGKDSTITLRGLRFFQREKTEAEKNRKVAQLPKSRWRFDKSDNDHLTAMATSPRVV